MQVKVQLLHPNAILPTYGTKQSAAFDLYAAHDADIFERAIVGTGLAFEIPAGYAMSIRSRSGLAFKHGVHAFPGTIDSDYRGEVKILLMSETPGEYNQIRCGDRIAQAIIEKVENVEFFVSKSLSQTERGAGGFGSTG